MADEIVTAVIAGGVALSAAYLTQFVSERAKRHAEGAAVAAAIAGELAAYAPAWPLLQSHLKRWVTLIESDQRDAIIFRPFERPKDMVIDELIPKLGLLGAAQVEAVVSVYANVRSFRLAMEMVITEHATMGDAELSSRIGVARERLDVAAQIGTALLPQLVARSKQPFSSWASKSRIAGVMVLCALLVWFGASLVRVENQRYALEVGLCGSDPLKVLSRAECLKSVESRSGWWWHLMYGLRGS